MTQFLSELPMYILSLPVILLSLSVHESSHGLAAYYLGDPTARSLGRLTLNPLKHFDLWGFLCMVFFHFGWAKPVPINARNFKKPRRDMALSAAAGPISNVLLSLVFGLLLLVECLASKTFVFTSLTEDSISLGFTLLSALCYILYIGVMLNISLAVFNMIPIPPFDGSRILFLLLPKKWYFAVMKYEQYIMIGLFILLFFTSFVTNILSSVTGFLTDLIMTLFGFHSNQSLFLTFAIQINTITSLL